MMSFGTVKSVTGYSRAARVLKNPLPRRLISYTG